jgi:hypothetical protein
MAGGQNLRIVSSLTAMRRKGIGLAPCLHAPARVGRPSNGRGWVILKYYEFLVICQWHIIDEFVANFYFKGRLSFYAVIAFFGFFAEVHSIPLH